MFCVDLNEKHQRRNLPVCKVQPRKLIKWVLVKNSVFVLEFPVNAFLLERLGWHHPSTLDHHVNESIDKYLFEMFYKSQ